MGFRPRISLRALFVVVTLVALACGYFWWKQRRLERFAAMCDKAQKEIDKVVATLRTDLGVCPAPWITDDPKDFDRAKYDFWTAELQAKPRVEGYFHQKEIFNVTSAETAQLVLQRHSQALQSAGFKLVRQDQITAKYGTKTVLIFDDPEGPAEIEVSILDAEALLVSVDVGWK